MTPVQLTVGTDDLSEAATRRRGMRPAAFAFQGHFLRHAHALSWGRTGDTHMSQDTQQDHISKKRVVYTMPGVDAVTIAKHVRSFW